MIVITTRTGKDSQKYPQTPPISALLGRSVLTNLQTFIFMPSLSDENVKSKYPNKI